VDVNIDSPIFNDFDEKKLKRKLKKDFDCKDLKVKCPTPPKKNRLSRKKRKIY